MAKLDFILILWMKIFFIECVKHRLFIFVFLMFILSESFARLLPFGVPAKYGIKEDSQESLTEINPHALNVAERFDLEEIFGITGKSQTMFEFEYSSALVLEGYKIGNGAFTVSASDRRGLFGGESYVDLSSITTIDSYYADQIRLIMGWKYNINKYLDIDIGGNVYWASKDIVGIGLPGPGYRVGGDFYVGLLVKELYIMPFAYVAYNSPLDAVKYMAGFAPRFEIGEYVGIENLAIESCMMFGYTFANRWADDHVFSNGKWRNSYGYIQTEANLVWYFHENWKVSVGVGWAINNDGHGNVGPDGMDMGSDNNVWGNFSLGFKF